MPDGSKKYVRRFALAPGEYHKNFQKIDRETIEAVTSERADAVTPLMAKIYLRLITAPPSYWEREGVLRFEAELREAGQLKAWTLLCQLLGVASATARKAVSWLHEEGIIGYFAGKNGVGIRIFINRAASSIGARPEPARQNFLRAPRASSQLPRASPNEPTFKGSETVLETSDEELKAPAPENGAAGTTLPVGGINVEEIIARLRQELEPSLTKAAGRAATEEMARTREWFEARALPKAVRVAQHATYRLIKRDSDANEKALRTKAELQVGRGISPDEPAEESNGIGIEETAELCVSMLQAHGKPIEATLAEISTDEGGWLLREDQPKVLAAAQRLLRSA